MALIIDLVVLILVFGLIYTFMMYIPLPPNIKNLLICCFIVIALIGLVGYLGGAWPLFPGRRVC